MNSTVLDYLSTNISTNFYSSYCCNFPVFVFCVALKNLLSFLLSCCVPGVNDEHWKTDQWSVSWSLLPIRSHRLETGPTVWWIQPRINDCFDLRGPRRFQISRCTRRNREMWTGTGMILLFFPNPSGDCKFHCLIYGADLWWFFCQFFFCKIVPDFRRLMKKHE